VGTCWAAGRGTGAHQQAASGSRLVHSAAECLPGGVQDAGAPLCLDAAWPARLAALARRRLPGSSNRRGLLMHAVGKQRAAQRGNHMLSGNHPCSTFMFPMSVACCSCGPTGCPSVRTCSGACRRCPSMAMRKPTGGGLWHEGAWSCLLPHSAHCMDAQHAHDAHNDLRHNHTTATCRCDSFAVAHAVASALWPLCPGCPAGALRRCRATSCAGW